MTHLIVLLLDRGGPPAEDAAAYSVLSPVAYTSGAGRPAPARATRDAERAYAHCPRQRPALDSEAARRRRAAGSLRAALVTLGVVLLTAEILDFCVDVSAEDFVAADGLPDLLEDLAQCRVFEGGENYDGLVDVPVKAGAIVVPRL
jgi:hypothetical protein